MVFSERDEVKDVSRFSADWASTVLFLPNFTTSKENKRKSHVRGVPPAFVTRHRQPFQSRLKDIHCGTLRHYESWWAVLLVKQASGEKPGPRSEPFLFDISTGQEKTHWWWQTIMWSSPATWRWTQIWSHLTTRSFTDFWKAYIIFKFCCEKYVNWAFIKPNLSYHIAFR